MKLMSKTMENEQVEVLKKSLQRIYNEVDKLPSEKGFYQADIYGEHYNKILSEAKELFPDNELILKLYKIKEVGFKGYATPAEIIELQKNIVNIKLYTLKIMDILDVSVVNETQVPQQVINVSQIQHTEQLVKLDIKNLVEAIQQQQNIDNNLKKEAIRSIKEFEEELKKPNPEPNKIRKSIDSVLKVGKEFSIPLLLKLIENWDKIFGK